MAQGSADDTQSAPMALVLAAFGLFVVRKRRA
jgi:MYXO-CTERM domain-containing protein